MWVVVTSWHFGNCFQVLTCWKSGIFIKHGNIVNHQLHIEGLSVKPGLLAVSSKCSCIKVNWFLFNMKCTNCCAVYIKGLNMAMLVSSYKFFWNSIKKLAQMNFWKWTWALNYMSTVVKRHYSLVKSALASAKMLVLLQINKKFQELDFRMLLLYGFLLKIFCIF